MGDQEKRGSNLAQRIRRQYDILVVGGIGHNSRACTNPIPRWVWVYIYIFIALLAIVTRLEHLLILCVKYLKFYFLIYL